MPDPDLWPELLLRLSRREDLGTEDAATSGAIATFTVVKTKGR